MFSLSNSSDTLEPFAGVRWIVPVFNSAFSLSGDPSQTFWPRSIIINSSQRASASAITLVVTMIVLLWFFKLRMYSHILWVL